MLNMYDFKDSIEQPCVQVTKNILKQRTYCIKHKKTKCGYCSNMKKHIMHTYE